MRNFKLIGMALLAIMLCMNFVSCSDDDKDIDVISLEGTWGMTYCKYFDYRDNSLSDIIPMRHLKIMKNGLSKN